MNLNPFHKLILRSILFESIIVITILYIISSNNLKPLEIISSLAIKDLIAVLGISAFVIGTFLLLGANFKQMQNYHLKSFEFSIKYQILTIGGLYVSLIIYAILYIFYEIREPLFFLIPLVLILHGSYLTGKPEIVTLKMVTFNEQGSKKIETRSELELYGTTDKDYRFKDLNGNEFIIPNNQVLEIIHLDKPKKVEKIPIKNIGKS